MKAESKHTFMVWAIVVLAIMNISTLVTILYHQYQSEKLETSPAQAEQQKEAGSENFSGRYFRDKLQLCNSQMEKFREFNPVFRQKAMEINFELSEKRKKMLVEMADVNSDTSRLNMLSDSIGVLHSDLKKITYKYYLQMKNICNNEQQKQLQQLFSEVFTSDMSIGMQGKGGQKRWQHGKRFKN